MKPKIADRITRRVLSWVTPGAPSRTILFIIKSEDEWHQTLGQKFRDAPKLYFLCINLPSPSKVIKRGSLVSVSGEVGPRTTPPIGWRLIAPILGDRKLFRLIRSPYRQFWVKESGGRNNRLLLESCAS